METLVDWRQGTPKRSNVYLVTVEDQRGNRCVRFKLYSKKKDETAWKLDEGERVIAWGESPKPSNLSYLVEQTSGAESTNWGNDSTIKEERSHLTVK